MKFLKNTLFVFFFSCSFLLSSISTPVLAADNRQQPGISPLLLIVGVSTLIAKVSLDFWAVSQDKKIANSLDEIKKQTSNQELVQKLGYAQSQAKADYVLTYISAIPSLFILLLTCKPNVMKLATVFVFTFEGASIIPTVLYRGILDGVAKLANIDQEVSKRVTAIRKDSDAPLIVHIVFGIAGIPFYYRVHKYLKRSNANPSPGPHPKPGPEGGGRGPGNYASPQNFVLGGGSGSGAGAFAVPSARSLDLHSEGLEQQMPGGVVALEIMPPEQLEGSGHPTDEYPLEGQPHQEPEIDNSRREGARPGVSH